MRFPYREPRRPFSLKDAFHQLLLPLVRLLSALRVRPDTLTILGWTLSVVSAVLFGLGYMRSAGLVMLLGGLFDALDGAVARESNRMSAF
ncbi:MAG TPA: CDP-alcohol phosphatidyltransferase family protein, partial [Rubrobacteraceae bacterium]|nr:CDP-alcohol phosphatidyltransferase family protein [Rubrobacteraceae bacterium]